MSELFKIYEPTDDYIYNRQLVMEFYETYYGIHDFTKPGQALTPIAMHPKEEYFKNGIQDNRLRKYLELDVYAKTGLTFDEYLDRPRYEIERLDRVLTEFRIKVNKLEEKTQEDLKRDQERQQKDAMRKTPKSMHRKDE